MNECVFLSHTSFTLCVPLCPSSPPLSVSSSCFLLLAHSRSLPVSPINLLSSIYQHFPAPTITGSTTQECVSVCVIILIYNMLTIRTECPLWMHLYMPESVFLHYIDCESNWENWSVSYVAHLSQSYICLCNVRRWQRCWRWEGEYTEGAHQRNAQIAFPPSKYVQTEKHTHTHVVINIHDTNSQKSWEDFNDVWQLSTTPKLHTAPSPPDLWFLCWGRYQ